MEATEAKSAAPAIESWAQIPWQKLEKHVYHIQKRIYKAQLAGNTQAVHSLQRLLMKSEAARSLAVRRVTQDNQGKQTAGIDGVKNVSPAQRPALVHALGTPAAIQAQPVRRVWIPKPGKTEKRPLGIPVILDRAHQALAKLALEPQWEARFEPNSYGFRPGRSCHDAIGAIFNEVARVEKYVLDADIEGCFDNIDHHALLNKLDAPASIQRAVKGWLRAGVMTGLDFSPTPRGTPQGGVISPLLANIALHGIEDVAYQSYRERDYPGQKPTGPRLIRYADDFVVLCRTREGIDAARKAIEQWLAGIGLRLSPRKTRIAHTLRQEGANAAGFDFLGFTVRQYPVGKYRAGRRNNGQRLQFAARIKPSKEAIKRHTRALHTVIQKLGTTPQAALIERLNPLIKGWANYYRTVVAKEVFHACDNRLFGQLWRWAVRRHPLKNRKWIAARYWNMQPGAKWHFVTKQDGQVAFSLARHDTTRIARHVKVRGSASPYDGNLRYWSQRLTNHPLTHGEEARLLRRQGGICPYCQLRLREEDVREIDHRIPRVAGGSNALANKQVLHRHCHDKKTAADAGGAYAKGLLVEELGVGKPTCPVLQTSRSREGRA